MLLYYDCLILYSGNFSIEQDLSILSKKPVLPVLHKTVNQNPEEPSVYIENSEINLKPRSKPYLIDWVVDKDKTIEAIVDKADKVIYRASLINGNDWATITYTYQNLLCDYNNPQLKGIDGLRERFISLEENQNVARKIVEDLSNFFMVRL